MLQSLQCDRCHPGAHPTGEGEQMSTLRFSDGVEIDTSGPLRIVQLNDGLYVIGQGMSIPVTTVQEGENIITKLREHRS
jgi:hypothetical protein